MKCEYRTRFRHSEHTSPSSPKDGDHDNAAAPALDGSSVERFLSFLFHYITPNSKVLPFYFVNNRIVNPKENRRANYPYKSRVQPTAEGAFDYLVARRVVNVEHNQSGA